MTKSDGRHDEEKMLRLQTLREMSTRDKLELSDADVCLSDETWESIQSKRAVRVSNAVKSAIEHGVEVDHLNFSVSPLDKGFSVKSAESLADLLLRDKLERRERISRGETHLVSNGPYFSDSAINTLSVEMMQNCIDTGAAIPPSLNALIRVQLDTDAGENEAAFFKRMAQREAALELLFSMPELSMAKVAAMVGVNKTSLSRWRKEPDFEMWLDTEEGRAVLQWKYNFKDRKKRLEKPNKI